MKIFKAYILLVLVLVSVLSCKKNKNEETIPLSTDEFIHYTVNGTAYNYDMPVDTIKADTSTDVLPITEDWASVTANGHSGTARLIYSQPAGLGTCRLFDFATPQVPNYPDISAVLATIDVHITEYDIIGKYIAGNFSGTFTNSINNNADSIQQVTFSFRVKRRQ